jgi:CDP-6-deoxy-D-xylo-4-hexulose-3-dehydrase
MKWKEWLPGDPVTINRIVWDHVEYEAVREVFERDWFGPGHFAGLAERFLRRVFERKHAQLVNSGSSALLLATLGLRKQGRWKPGDLILHPACTFPTSCNPIWQAGMKPVFVDVEEGTYNVDGFWFQAALQDYPEIQGAIIPHLIGNSPDMTIIVDALDGRPLIEDCCDTFGSTYGEQKLAGRFGDAAAFSFYGSHHVTAAGVGGALLCDDDDLAAIVHSMTFWGRDFTPTGDAYSDFCNRYTYREIGFDMQMTEMQAAFLLAQFERVVAANEKRAVQFKRTYNLFKRHEGWFVLPRSHPQANPSWFGFPVLVREEAPFDREAFARHLLDNKIEIRPLFAGNLLRQPAYRDMPDRALFLPAWGGMSEGATDYMFSVIREFLRKW